jgi:hypothetical protein
VVVNLDGKNSCHRDAAATDPYRRPLEHIYKLHLMKNASYTIIILILSCSSIDLYSQNEYAIESETHIFWQPNRRLLITDFQGGNSTDSKFNEDKELGRTVIPCLGIFLKVDIPKNYRKNKLEKVYFAPAFQKSCSFLLDNDTSNFRDAQIQFDMYEFATRIARRIIWDTHAKMAIANDSALIDVIISNPDTILITGLGNIYAGRARDSAMNFVKEMTNAYLNDMYLKNDSTAASYEDWRSLIDKGLRNSEMFATKPEDCYRMIKNKPILKRYRTAK